MLSSTSKQSKSMTKGANKSQNDSKTKENGRTTMVRTKGFTKARKALQDMVKEIKNAEEKTLAYWRVVCDGKIIASLGNFCQEEDKEMNNEEDKVNHLTDSTLKLFQCLNYIMAEQERVVQLLPQQKYIDMRIPNIDFCKICHMSNKLSSTEEIDISTLKEDREVVAIVFGGKDADPAQSLSENLANTLVATCLHVYTASRSDMESKNENITHFQKKNLCDESEKGVQGFVDIIETCIKQYFSPQLDKKRRERVLVMYFTMGYHKGHDVYNANLRSATNFAQALLETLSFTSDATSDNNIRLTNTNISRGNIKWKVIVTGTDATRPSTQKNITVEWNRKLFTSPGDHPNNIGESKIQLEEGQSETIQLTVPSYKIGKWNYVYSMSKIGQFYIIADAIATLTISKSNYEKAQQNIKVNLSEVTKKITRHVNGAGDKFIYDETIKNIISMDELDKISSDWTESVQPLVTKHLAVATGLSILYTPLHCRSWVTQAVKSSNEDKAKYDGSVRAHIVFQIVKRLSNAISTDLGARCHTLHGYAEKACGNEETVTATILK